MPRSHVQNEVHNGILSSRWRHVWSVRPLAYRVVLSWRKQSTVALAMVRYHMGSHDGSRIYPLTMTARTLAY